MDPVDRLNHLLDALPRTRFGSLAREAPAFRTCGVVGLYLAVVITLATGAARGRSLSVVAALCAVCGASFFVYALARKRITGKENLVLLEHVWFALGCATGALVALGESPLPYLDAVASGLAFFLAAGRVGCFLVGCCHGYPSSLGVRYGVDHERDGLATHWVGVRLFPIQLVEAAALATIGTVTVLFALVGTDGAALFFFLVAYGVIRFGLEGLRGDERPHMLRISQPRWMAVAQIAAAIGLAEAGGARSRALAVLGVVTAAWLIHAARASRSGLVARALTHGHLRALREAAASTTAPPVAARSPLGFGVAASPSSRGRHVSLSGCNASLDLPLLCKVAAGSFPDLDPATAVLGRGGVLLFEVPVHAAAAPPNPDLWVRLFAAISRARQQEGASSSRAQEAVPPGRPAEPNLSGAPPSGHSGDDGARGASSVASIPRLPEQPAADDHAPSRARYFASAGASPKSVI